MASEREAILATGLTKFYGPEKVVADLDLACDYGEVVGLLGPNGSGKTTTLRMLLGLVDPTAGSILVHGAPPRDIAARRRTGSVFDTPAFVPHLSGRDNLGLLARYAGLQVDLDAALDGAGLADAATRQVCRYSHGMRQRLALAAALLGDPRLLILDEPLGGLDPLAIEDLRAVIAGAAQAGAAVLMSSHIVSEVELTCDRVVVMRVGRAVLEGPVSGLVARDALVIRVTPVERAATVLRAAGLALAGPFDDEELVVVDAAGRAAELARRLIAEDVDLHELRPARGDLATVVQDALREPTSEALPSSRPAVPA